MQTQNRFYSSHIPSWVFLPLRLFLGITFVYAGIQKFIDPQFFHPDTAGFIGKQLHAFSTSSPIGGFLLNVAAPHALFFGYLVAYGEIAIGLGILFGFLFRAAAFFGMLISFIFFFSVTWRVYPYFYGADIVFVFCWLTMLLNGPLNTGLPTLDEFLTLHFLQRSSPERQARLANALYIILGTTPPSQETIDITPAPSTASSIAPVAASNQKRSTSNQRRISAIQRAQEARRHFLNGVLTGGISIVSIGAIVVLFRSLTNGNGTTSTSAANPMATSDTTPPNTMPTATSASGTPTSSSKAIAQVSAVASNSSTNFTIPASGDPGILVHLSNNQFVAYDAICTHAGCTVDYDPSQQMLVCPCHGAAFDPSKAAEVVQGPAPTPLTSVSIHIDSATGTITLA